VHWGATSQDIIDTALALELRSVLDALASDLDRAVAARFDKSQRIRRARQHESARHGARLSDVVAAALRWFRRPPSPPR
jgi:hypothetical protein